jgi:pyruvate kinase
MRFLPLIACPQNPNRKIMRRNRNAKIVATLGPASSSEEVIRKLFVAGVDMFRLNFSHGTHAEHKERFDTVRRIGREFNRPIGILADLQGPKLRVGKFAPDGITLAPGATFRLDLNPTEGDANRVNLPHPEIFAALVHGATLLLDDGKLELRVEEFGRDFALTRVVVGGRLTDRKGVNVPSLLLPISPLTAKDRRDLQYAFELGVDWIALSFVQRPEDIFEARVIIGDKALVMTKLEKPAAIDRLDEIVRASDSVMVARGDLGVELPPERVPILQRAIIRACRREGKPVIVATQMLESMTASPVPTRAEASDVASAVFQGADAVMLSAESAAGKYPVEAVTMMDRIIGQVEADPHYRALLEADHEQARSTVADAVCAALRQTAHIVSAKATITYTSSGASAFRAARERPEAPILSLTPSARTAGQLSVVWGVHSLLTTEAPDVVTMTDMACRAALQEGFAAAGDYVVIAAGVPFGHSGTTNLLRIAKVGANGADDGLPPRS